MNDRWGKGRGDAVGGVQGEDRGVFLHSQRNEGSPRKEEQVAFKEGAETVGSSRNPCAGLCVINFEGKSNSNTQVQDQSQKLQK